jgi:hypothetical protein
MNTVSVTLSALVDKALLELQGPTGAGRQVVMSGTVLTDPASRQLTLAGTDTVAVSDVIQFSDELMLVTDVTDGVITVSRGYYGTLATTYQDGQVGFVNPPWPRKRVAEGVKRSFPRLEALGVPLVRSATFSRVADMQYVEMPAETRDVLHVGYFDSSGRFWDIPQWRYFQDLPTSKVTSGKIVRLPSFVANADELEITYRVPYRWANHPDAPYGDTTIEVPEGAEDLPSTYAAAWCLSAREVSRSELDVAEEWNRGEPQRGGVSLSLVRAKWQEFYRALDEARRLNHIPTHRPYVRMPRFT